MILSVISLLVDVSQFNSMKKYLLITFILLCYFSGYGQYPGMGKKGPSLKGKISGSVIDSSTNLPIGFAAISLRRTGVDKIINGSLSEDDGRFVFTDVTPG